VLERVDGHARRTDRHPRACGRVEHPRGDHLAGAIGHHADEDDLTASNFTVLHVDLASVRGVPRVVDLSAKRDMGRMRRELPWAEKLPFCRL
jgi:hypothetical protein